MNSATADPDNLGADVEWVRYGRPAAAALRSAIADAKGDEPLSPVTVVVPSNHVGVATRRLLASGKLGPTCSRGRGLIAVTFVTPYRMADLYGSARLAGQGRRPVSTPVIAAALRGALAGNPGLFAPVAQHPATEAALVGAYRELRDLSEDALDALAATSARASDVVRLHRAAIGALRAAWYDEQDLIVAAIEAFGAGPTGPPLGAVMVYLPQRLSRHSAALIRSVAQRLPVRVVGGTTGDPRADAEVTTSLARLGIGGEPPVFEAEEVVDADRTRIVTVSDADEEVRMAVRAVVDAVRAGTTLDRIAILHAGREPYARLVHEHCHAAGIATNGSSVVPLAARVAGRTLLNVLSLPAAGFRRQDVFALLAGAPVLLRGRPAPTTAWERLSRKAAVVAGRHQWDRLLAGLAADRDEKAAAAEADPDQPVWRGERLRDEATRARDLRQFVLELIDDLQDASAAPRRWSEHATWAHALLTRLLGGPTRRGRWPQDERSAAERLDVALDRLAALDDVEGAVGLDVFRRTLDVELEADLGRVGRFGDGVLVGSLSMGLGLDLDLVIVLGLAEGSFPSPLREDSLLPDDERQAADGELALRAQGIERQHRELLAALAGAGHQLLCIPRGDLRRSSDRVPSRWVLDFASRLAGERWWSSDLRDADRPWVEHVASFASGIRQVTFPATSQEHRLRCLLAGERIVPLTMSDVARSDRVLQAGAQVVAERASHRFTRFDGNLAGVSAPSPAAGVTSATRLERWAVCPFGYLLQDVLGAEPVENPEEELMITALDWGSLVHEVLEHFIKETLDLPPEQMIGPGVAWPPEHRERLESIAAQHFAAYEARGLTGRTIFWNRDRRRILADLRRFLDMDSAHRAAHRLTPVAAELAFGFRGAAVGPVAIALPDGRAVCFRGLADRVDRAENGTLRVVDYKTGRAGGFSDLSPQNPDLRGRKLQLPVYGVAARMHSDLPEAAVYAEYWFVSTKGEFKRVGYEVTGDVLERIGRTLGTIVQGIEAGVFPNYPPATPNPVFVECPSCDPDGLGVTELGRAWLRKRADPSLAAFANLVEPDAATGSASEASD